MKLLIGTKSVHKVTVLYMFHTSHLCLEHQCFIKINLHKNQFVIGNHEVHESLHRKSSQSYASAILTIKPLAI